MNNKFLLEIIRDAVENTENHENCGNIPSYIEDMTDYCADTVVAGQKIINKFANVIDDEQSFWSMLCGSLISIESLRLEKSDPIGSLLMAEGLHNLRLLNLVETAIKFGVGLAGREELI